MELPLLEEIKPLYVLMWRIRCVLVRREGKKPGKKLSLSLMGNEHPNYPTIPHPCKYPV